MESVIGHRLLLLCTCISAVCLNILICLSMQQSLKTEREKKREIYFPMRKYAIKV